MQPTVINENLATAGIIAIDTRVDTLTADTKNYAHTISIKNLSLTNDKGEQLTDLSILEYGDFITQPRNSARLEVPFSNYASIEPMLCTTAPIDSTLRFYKTINDEFIVLDVPEEADLFENVATPDTIPRTLDLKEREVFKYVVFNTLATDLACTTAFAENIKSWQLVSTSGTLKVVTVASMPEADGSIAYTHTITLENMVLTSKASGAGTNNVNLAAIPEVEFGTYTTIQE